MAKKEKKNSKKTISSGKFPLVIIPIVLVCIGIMYKMLMTMTVEREKWEDLRKENFEKDSVELKPNRGNILSAEGELLASSLPNYKVRFDFLAGIPVLKTKRDTVNGQVVVRNLYTAKDSIARDSLLRERDSLIIRNLPAISGGLARICPALDSAGYYAHMKEGLEKRARYFDICPGYILNYIQYNQLRELPVFDIRHKYKSGLIVEERNNRKKPFGSLARRTLGEMFGAKDSARSGLELAYDTLLRGESGIMHQRRIRSKNVDIVDKEPVDGYDLVSTINVSMQDICETALREKLIEVNAEFGVVVLMETKTGDVKAIVNLARDSVSGKYYEMRNYALAALMEPGSTFKTASIMVALDDGEIKLSDKVDTGSGIYNMHGARMKDANWSRGGCGVLDVTLAVVRSSNIGVSRFIDMHYHDKPEKFIEGLKRVGIGTPLGLPFYGMADPRIFGPENKSYWSEVALPWMSIGYGTQIPPISTVTFYNAIANGGRMVRPRFVKGISKNGEMIEEFPVEVIKEQICKPQTLKDIQGILWQVVNNKNYGTGKRAGSKHFSVSGKTGTAQVAIGGGYHNGRTEHLVSFCGYYPSENPQYTCIVAIRTAAGGVGGGGTAGPVFAKIAERVYSKNVTTDIRRASDSLSVFVPSVKAGDMTAAASLLKRLHIPYTGGAEGWGHATHDDQQVSFTTQPTDTALVPDMSGMGARDAVFAIESRGMRARVHGMGRVKSQSVPPGSKIKKGQVITLEMN